METEAGLGERQLGSTIGTRRRTGSVSDDYSVQKTNEDASECKYVAAKLGYFKDPFLNRFISGSDVGVRRDPEISRGYWARVSAIKAVVNTFLRMFGPKAQIVNLGAGFDTLYWRLKDAQKGFSKFVEADFSSVTAKKIRHLQKTNSTNLVKLFSKTPQVSDHTDLHAGDYHLIGADLRQRNELHSKIGKCGLESDAPTLFLAECVLVYMGHSQSHELLTELANWFPNSFFCSYEQVNILDTFGKVMVTNLEQRGIILPGLDACETLETQKKRHVIAPHYYFQLIAVTLKEKFKIHFDESGWNIVMMATMKDIYEIKLPRNEIERIEKIEFLDEKILLSQLLEHYCFAIASTKSVDLNVDWNQVQ